MKQNPLVTLDLGGLSMFRMQPRIKVNTTPPPDRPRDVLYCLPNGNGKSKKRKARASAAK